MINDVKWLYAKFDEKMAPWVPVLIMYMAIYVIAAVVILL